MRRSLLLILLCPLLMAQQYNVPFHPRAAGGGGGCGSNTPTFIQLDIDDQASAASAQSIMPSNVTAGSTIICSVRLGGAPTPTICDSLGNTYSQDKSQAEASDHTHIVWHAYSPSGGADTVTICRNGGTCPGSCTAGNGSIRFACHEYSHIASSDPVDQTASTDDSTPGTSHSTGTVTTTCNNELLYGSFSFSSGQLDPGWTVGDMGFGSGSATIRAEVSNIPATSNWRLVTEERTTTSTSSGYKANCTSSGSTAAADILVTYKAD